MLVCCNPGCSTGLWSSPLIDQSALDLVKDLLLSTQQASYWHFPPWSSQHSGQSSWHELPNHRCFVSLLRAAQGPMGPGMV